MYLHMQTNRREFNLSFHLPRKDTGKTWDTLKVKIDAADTDDEKRVLVGG